MTVSPDLLIVLGPRGLLSLVGIVLIVGGVWRKWLFMPQLGSNNFSIFLTLLAYSTPLLLLVLLQVWIVPGTKWARQPTSERF